MHRRLLFATAMIALAAPAVAQSPDETMIEETGGATAAAVVCKKITPAQAARHKAEVAPLYVGKGVTAAQFEAIYTRGYNDLVARMKTATPAQIEQGCKRMPAGG